MASFYYSIYASMTFTSQPQHQHKIYGAIIFLLPVALALISNACEYDYEDKIDAMGKYKRFSVTKVLIDMELDIHNKMNAVRSAFACMPELDSLSEVTILQLPQLIGLAITLYYSVRTKKLLQTAVKYTSGTTNAASKDVLTLQKKAARAMHRFAVVAVCFILGRTASMLVFYPQLEGYSDELYKFYKCFHYEAFEKTPYGFFDRCVREKGQHLAAQCVDIGMQRCASPLESDDVPTLLFYRMLTATSVALPLAFGILMTWKLIAGASLCSKKRKRVVPRLHTTKASTAVPSAEENTLTEESES